MEYEGEYRYNKKWNGKGYDKKGNVIYELINGTGKVKEYSEDILLFEGEYLNGQKHGKGKEYTAFGKLIFEGEYLNGKKQGKGREYDHAGKLLYEGEYLNGKRNGKGKEYDYNGLLLYEGKWKNNKKEGYGIFNK